jgi:5,10-methylenetetrahydromethanopterin reductase
VTHLAARDVPLLDHVDLDTMVGDSASIARKLGRLAQAGFCEVIYTPAGPDVARELRAFARAHRARGQ